MIRRFAPWLSMLPLAVGLVACGPSKEELALAQLQKDMAAANAVIDSLNYTVESSNLLIDNMRAQVDSTQQVNDKLLASVEKLSKEVRRWRQLATEYKQNNEKITAEIERLKVARQADQQTIARMRVESDSLAVALLDAHTSIRRQSDRIRQMEVQLAQAQDEAATLRKAEQGVTLFVGSEAFLKENGYLSRNRSLGRALRKVFHLKKKLTPGDAGVRLVALGEPISIDGKLDGVVDRYGKLKKGDDYRVESQDGHVNITFVNELLGGSDVVVVLKD